MKNIKYIFVYLVEILLSHKNNQMKYTFSEKKYCLLRFNLIKWPYFILNV